MLSQYRRWWANIKTTLVKCPVLALDGYFLYSEFSSIWINYVRINLCWNGEYSRSCHQRPCFCQTKKVVGDRKSLVTGMSFCCKICGCGGWFNVGLMIFTHHWPVVFVDQSTRLWQHFNACSNITDYEEHYAHTKMFVPSRSQQTQYVESMLV